MSDRNLIDHIRRQTEKRYEHLQEASREELVEFALTEFEASQPFKDYRDIIKKNGDEDHCAVCQRRRN